MIGLGDVAASVNAAARDSLTHAITINGKTVRAQGHYGDGEMVGIGSTSIRQEIELMVLKADWPSEPTRSDIVISPVKPGKRFRPSNVQTSDDGAHWIFNLVKIGT